MTHRKKVVPKKSGKSSRNRPSRLRHLAIAPPAPPAHPTNRCVVDTPVNLTERPEVMEARVRTEQLEDILLREYKSQGKSNAEAARLVQLAKRTIGIMHEIPDPIHKAAHYQGGAKFEVIEIIDDHGLDFYRGTIVKYVLRAPYKGTTVDDLKKAKYYLDRLVRLTENGEGPLQVVGL